MKNFLYNAEVPQRKEKASKNVEEECTDKEGRTHVEECAGTLTSVLLTEEIPAPKTMETNTSMSKRDKAFTNNRQPKDFRPQLQSVQVGRRSQRSLSPTILHRKKVKPFMLFKLD